jgi:putative tryptophan/tyrosine transport system substrate-binding protein
MRRRELITLLGGASAWPFAAFAEQGQIRRIGVFMPANNAEGKSRLTAFVRGLHEFGWIVGQNIRIDERWGDGNADSMR